MDENDIRNAVCIRGHSTSMGRTKSRNCKTCIKLQNKIWRSTHPGYKSPAEIKNPDYYRKRALITSYGINLKQYNDLLQKQNGECAICGTKNSLSNGKTAGAHLSVDHDHVRGHIRQLLCGNCNRGLGLFAENPEFLRKAANYIETHLEKSNG